MKKTLCLCLAATLICLAGCTYITADYSSGGNPPTSNTYTTSIVGTFESESDASSSSRPPSSQTPESSEKNEASSSASSRPSSAASASSQPASSQQSSSNTQNDPTFTPSGNTYYHYYENLTDAQKRLYGIINDAAENMTSGMIALGNCSIEDVALAFNAVMTDHPEYFWMPSSYMNRVDSKGKRFIAMDYVGDKDSVFYKCTPEEKKAMQAQLDAKINEIRKLIPQSGISLYNFELILHDWLCENVTYVQSDNPLISTAYGAIVNGEALCEGYARAMQLLCNEFGIPCTLICGEGYNKDTGSWENHMWNLVKLDNDWYHVDVTWDDQNTLGATFHNYFNLADSDILEKTHKASPDFTNMSSADLLDGKSYNLSLPSCKSHKESYPTRAGCTLSENIDPSRVVITEIIKNAVMQNKKYCEFYLTYDIGSGVTGNDIAQKYSLLSAINDVNSSSVKKISTATGSIRTTLSDRMFAVFFEYEGE